MLLLVLVPFSFFLFLTPFTSPAGAPRDFQPSRDSFFWQTAKFLVPLGLEPLSFPHYAIRRFPCFGRFFFFVLSNSSFHLEKDSASDPLCCLRNRIAGWDPPSWVEYVALSKGGPFCFCHSPSPFSRKQPFFSPNPFSTVFFPITVPNPSELTPSTAIFVLLPTYSPPPVC